MKSNHSTARAVNATGLPVDSLLGVALDRIADEEAQP
jgi:hypothetical protein